MIILPGELAEYFGEKHSLRMRRYANQQNVLRRGYLTEIAILAITDAFARKPSRIAVHLPSLFNIR
jgi:hypothetical protein